MKNCFSVGIHEHVSDIHESKKQRVSQMRPTKDGCSGVVTVSRKIGDFCVVNV